MPAHSYETWTIRKLRNYIDNGEIDLAPDWQRGSVWPKNQKPKLIDSIKNGFPIPHLIVWKRPDGTMVMVDGKQRTETIHGYINDYFAAYDNEWFSGLPEDEQEAFLDIEVQVLLFHASVEEGDIVTHFERINSGGKQLSNGELINSQCMTPIVSLARRAFFSPSRFLDEWIKTFGKPSTRPKRMKHYENTVPYLISSIYGVQFLTKSYPVIASHLRSTSSGDLAPYIPKFMEQLNLFLDIVRGIFQEFPQLSARWKKSGLPPLRQTSAIWLSIIQPQNSIDLRVLWPTFYGTLSRNTVLLNEWNKFIKKNAAPTQLSDEVQFAIDKVNANTSN